MTAIGTVLVLGATGRQGRAVARQLLQRGTRVRALTRDPRSEGAGALAAQGVEIMGGDLDDAASLAHAMSGVDGVFSVQPVSDSAAGLEDEARRGKRVASEAARAGVKHLVYSSVGGADGQAQFRFSPKWEIEQHVRSLALPATILRPAGFMEDIVGPRFGVPSGHFTTALAPRTRCPLIAVEDIGVFAALAFAAPGSFGQAPVELAGDALTPPEIAGALGLELGRPIDYIQVPLDVLRAKSPEAARVFQWANEAGYAIDIPALRRRHPRLETFAAWLARRAGTGR